MKNYTYAMYVLLKEIIPWHHYSSLPINLSATYHRYGNKLLREYSSNLGGHNEENCKKKKNT